MARKRTSFEAGLEEPWPKRQARPSSCSEATECDVESTETHNMLLGVTQSGKSTAGNALTGSIPVHYDGANFVMGSGNVSCTTCFKSAVTTWNNQRVNFIDGPGLGETTGEEQEELNLYRLYRGLAAMGASNKKLSLIVIVVSFTGNLLDQKYTEHLQFYKKVFPRMFNANNAVILVTAYHANTAWQTTKGRDGHIPEDRLKEKLDFIRGILGVRLQHYCADFLSDDSEDVEHAKAVREAILKKSTEVAKVDLSSNHYPKLPGMKAADDHEIEILNQKRACVGSDLPEHVKTKEDKEREVRKIEAALNGAREARGLAKAERDRIISSGPVRVCDAKVTAGAFQFSNPEFEKSTEHPIRSHSIEGDAVRLTKNTTYVVAGQGKKKLFRPFYAHFQAYTSPRDRYKGEIELLDKVMNEKAGEIGQLSSDLEEKKEELRRARGNVQERRAQLDSITKRINYLEQDVFTIEQVCERFKEAHRLYEDDMH